MQPFYSKNLLSREEHFQQVYSHLMKYGKTIACKDINYIIKRLEEEGVACECCKREVRGEGHKRGKKEIYWVFECTE